MWRRGQSAHDVRRSRRATLIGVPVSWKRAITLGGGYPFAVLAVVAVAVVLLPLRTVLVLPALMLLFVPVIIGVARLLGARAAAASALAAFLVVDLLFIPPYYRLTGASRSGGVGFLGLLIVALLTGQQTARLRQRERASLARQRELELLNRLSSLIAFTQSVESTARFTVEQVAEVMGADRVALHDIPGDPATVRRPLDTAVMRLSGVRNLQDRERPLDAGAPRNQAVVLDGKPPQELAQPPDPGPTPRPLHDHRNQRRRRPSRQLLDAGQLW